MTGKNWFSGLKKAALWTPPVSLTAGGIYATFNSVATGAPASLVCGGVILGIYGAQAIDSLCGENNFSKKLSAVFDRAADQAMNQNTIMAVTGLAMSACFMHGDAVNLAQAHQLTWGNLQDINLKDIAGSHSFYSLAAGPLFASAAVLDFPRVYKSVSGRIGEKGTAILQGSLSAAGLLLTGFVGMRARLRPLMYYGLINAQARAITVAGRVLEPGIKN